MTRTITDGTNPTIRTNFNSRNTSSTMFAGIGQTHQLFGRCHVAPSEPDALDAFMVVEVLNSEQGIQCRWHHLADTSVAARLWDASCELTGVDPGTIRG